MTTPPETLLARARQARLDGRYPDAVRDLDDLLSIQRAQGGPGLVSALKAFGQIQRDLGMLAPALQSYREAVAVCRSLGDAHVLAHTLRHVADIERELGEMSFADASLAEALDIYRNARPDHLELANTIRIAALISEGTDRMESAIALWREAASLYQAAGVTEATAACRRRIEALSGHI